MFGTSNGRRMSLTPQNFWLVQDSVSSATFNNSAKYIRQFSRSNEIDDFIRRTNQDNCVEMDDGEPLQFCNLKENILRLEELAKKNGISLDDDRLDNNGQYLFQQLCEVNPSANMFARRDSLGSACWFNAGRRFSGLKPEHLPEENRLAQLVCQFGLEHVRELPELPMEMINNCLVAY